MKKGFTLIELLCVVAVIAIVAAIISPIIAASRMRGRTATVTSNMRQIAQAFVVYMDEYNLRIPPKDATPLMDFRGVHLLAYYPHEMASRQYMDGLPRYQAPFLGDFVYVRYTGEWMSDDIYGERANRYHSVPLLASLHDAGLHCLLLQERSIDPFGNESWDSNGRCPETGELVQMPEHVLVARADTSVSLHRLQTFGVNNAKILFDYHSFFEYGPITR
jgi:prepilin-type N-terminal cleavage/methylation domain-containing protein